MTYTPEYRDGDLVRVREWNALVREYGLDDYGYIKGSALDKKEYEIIPENRVILIIDTLGNGVRFKHKGMMTQYIEKRFIEGPAFEYGELIEVSYDGINWSGPFHYISYSDGEIYPYRISLKEDYKKSESIFGSINKYARKLKEERPLVGKECKVTCDGIEYDVILK